MRNKSWVGLCALCTSVQEKEKHSKRDMKVDPKLFLLLYFTFIYWFYIFWLFLNLPKNKKCNNQGHCLDVEIIRSRHRIKMQIDISFKYGATVSNTRSLMELPNACYPFLLLLHITFLYWFSVFYLFLYSLSFDTSGKEERKKPVWW